MADQPKPVTPSQSQNIGRVETRNIVDEMSSAYLDYAMSVIVARALPDVRDGLKPVHRRVLFAMHQMGLRSRSQYTKSAKIVGEVLGKYHPHGDQAAYDTLARMAQDFAMRYPLVDGQGNFGSMDGDAPAAMRYTEARMTKLAEELLTDIEKETVNFSPNYDNKELEPQYLPASYPQLLCNGALGIAVGMATNIPPHNLREVIAATKLVITNPDVTIDELMEVLPGPDLPTGAVMYNRADIHQAYSTGKGRIVMRAVAEIQERKSGHQIVVSTIPYQVNKADLVTKIAELVKAKRIDGISDLRDESDRTDKVRIVLELKANSYPRKVLNQLYELTPMQTAFHVNMIALVDGIQPRLLSVRDVLDEFVKHRIVVVRRRTEFELTKAEHRLHILLGLKIALDAIDQIISLIRSSATKEAAYAALIEQFHLSSEQANAILEMRLSALAGLERKKVDDEMAEKQALIETLKTLLSSDVKIRSVIITELDAIATNYGDDRRTKIIPSAVSEFSAKDLIPNEQVVITLTTGNYIKRVSLDAYKTQQRGGKGIVGLTTKEEDTVSDLAVANTHDDILFFTSRGRLFRSKVYELPSASRQAKGTPIVNIAQLGPEETVTAMITLTDGAQPGKFFFMGTRGGSVKKTEISKYQHIRASGIIAMGLHPGDALQWVRTTTGQQQIVMVTRRGQAIHFAESDVRPMGRSAAGVRGIRLRSGDEVIALDVVSSEDNELLVVLKRGLGKRTKIGLFGLQRRGGSGLRAAKVTTRTGEVVGAQLILGTEGDVVMISEQGQTIRMPLRSVKRLGRDTQGVTLMRFRESGDSVASLTVFRQTDDVTN
ncbi:DNA gyrase subunit A [Candidatus Berkelbacteria bacterium]|nr:DNA gyrase subunit A [Candidatus Berkelbacteria bacterium]